MFFFLNTLINHLIYIDVIIRIEKLLLVQNLNVVRLIRNKGRRKIRRGSERILTKKNKMVSCVVEIRLDLWNEMQIESSRAHPETMRANRAIPWLLYEFPSLFLLPSFPLRFADNSRINSQQIEIKTGPIWMQFTLSIHFAVTKKKRSEIRLDWKIG